MPERINGRVGNPNLSLPKQTLTYLIDMIIAEERRIKQREERLQAEKAKAQQ